MPHNTDVLRQEQAATRAGGSSALGERVLQAMERHRVPGVSIALLRDGEPAALEAFGVAAADGTAPVTPDTMFKVASVSKHIAALGALTLAAQGRLDLDTDINTYLRSWQVPTGAVEAPVTARQLLLNTSGMAPEPPSEPYRPGDPLPTLPQALRGEAPSRTPALRFECRPGTVFRKNELNYLLLEQVMTDITGRPFADLMRSHVFLPLGMVSSRYDRSHHERRRQPVARGHDRAGHPLRTGLPIHPSVAGGGLWSTAGDLARAAAEIRRAYLGQESELLTPALAREFLTPAAGSMYGLSTVVDATGEDLDFGIFGESGGYWAMTMTQVRSGTGLVVLTNGDSGREVGRALIADRAALAGLGRRW